MNDAMAVAIQATHFNTLTILSPVGLFCVIIIFILINNFIMVQRYIIILQMQILVVYFSFILVLYWSYTGVQQNKIMLQIPFEVLFYSVV
jgi:uncharacterized membrane protein YqiK